MNTKVEPGDIRVLTDEDQDGKELHVVHVNKVGPEKCHVQYVAHDVPGDVHTERLASARLAYRGAGRP